MAPLAQMAGRKVNVAYAEATGSFLVLLGVAQQQGFFQKLGVGVQPVATRGAAVPRLTGETPIGLIGEPAALLQAAAGAELRIVASLSSIKLSGHLVARHEIKRPEDLRGRTVGVRVLGAGIWISTILALEQLRLDPRRDKITILPTGSPVQILRALEEGSIDCALVSVAQSRELRAKGFSILLEDYPPDISSFAGGLVIAKSYLAANPDVVEKLVRALIEALAFSLAPANKAQVMRAFKTSLDIHDEDTAARNLRELTRRPYPSREALAKMQAIMSAHDARVLRIDLKDLIEDPFVRKLDESGIIDELFAAYGAR
jgi:ABC-type nitrate/sulfonate/bicarbonate transport system substrate-binding protein